MQRDEQRKVDLGTQGYSFGKHTVHVKGTHYLPTWTERMIAGEHIHLIANRGGWETFNAWTCTNDSKYHNCMDHQTTPGGLGVTEPRCPQFVRRAFDMFLREHGIEVPKRNAS